MGVENWQVVPDDFMANLMKNALAKKNGVAPEEKVFDLAGALQKGKGIPILNANNEVVGFDWGQLDAVGEGLTEEELNMKILAQMQSAALEAQIAQQQAGINTIRSSTERILSDPTLSDMGAMIAKYVSDPLSLPSTYKTDAGAVNAWADALVRANAADAARRGVAGSAETAKRDVDINLKRGAELDKAYARDKTAQAQFEASQRGQNIGFLSGLFGQKSAPLMNEAQTIAQLLANSNYQAPSNISLPKKNAGSTNWVAFGGANA